MTTINAITNLKGEQSKADYNFATVRATELDYAAKPLVRGIQFGRSGIVFYSGKVFLGIPWEELWKLAEGLEPGFAKPVPKTAPAPVLTATEAAAVPVNTQ